VLKTQICVTRPQCVKIYVIFYMAFSKKCEIKEVNFRFQYICKYTLEDLSTHI